MAADLGRSRVSAHEHVDLSSELAAGRSLLCAASSEQQAQDALLDVVELPDRRGQRARQLVVDAGLAGKVVDLALLLLDVLRSLVALADVHARGGGGVRSQLGGAGLVALVGQAAAVR